MPRETTLAKAARAKKIIAGLRKTYPDAHCELDHTTPLELLIATILSAQCTDKRVNLVTAKLFRKRRSAADYAEADLAELEQFSARASRGVLRHMTEDEEKAGLSWEEFRPQ